MTLIVRQSFQEHPARPGWRFGITALVFDRMGYVLVGEKVKEPGEFSIVNGGAEKTSSFRNHHPNVHNNPNASGSSTAASNSNEPSEK